MLKELYNDWNEQMKNAETISSTNVPNASGTLVETASLRRFTYRGRTIDWSRKLDDNCDINDPSKLTYANKFYVVETCKFIPPKKPNGPYQNAKYMTQILAALKDGDEHEKREQNRRFQARVEDISQTMLARKEKLSRLSFSEQEQKILLDWMCENITKPNSIIYDNVFMEVLMQFHADISGRINDVVDKVHVHQMYRMVATLFENISKTPDPYGNQYISSKACERWFAGNDDNLVATTRNIRRIFREIHAICKKQVVFTHVIKGLANYYMATTSLTPAMVVASVHNQHAKRVQAKLQKTTVKNNLGNIGYLFDGK